MTAEAKCGKCILFDTNGVDGQPFGNINVGGVTVRRGVCRGPKGLAISVGRTEVSNCGQPPGIFKPNTK